MLPLFISDVPLACINQAAQEYHVPAILIISVLNVERGRAGVISKNKNGSADFGSMQINSSWWPELYRYHITKRDVIYDPCTNVKVGAWILAQSIAESRNLLVGVGDYNSHTPGYNHAYQYKVRQSYTWLEKYLAKDT